MNWQLWIYEYFKHNEEGSTSKIGEFYRNRTGNYRASAYQIGNTLKRLFLKGILLRREVGLYDDENYSKFIYYLNDEATKRGVSELKLSKAQSPNTSLKELSSDNSQISSNDETSLNKSIINKEVQSL